MNESALIDQIYSTVADPNRWAEVMVSIADYLGAVGGLVDYIGPDGRSFIVLGRLSEERAKVYKEHYVSNAWSLAMRDVPDGRAVIVNDLLDPRALFKSGFYADVLAPQRIENAFGTRHNALSRDGGFGGFNFCLSSRGAEQAGHFLPRLQRLTPHLGRALEATMEMGRIAGGAQNMAAIVRLMPNPALLLDRRGRVVYANAAAESLLNASDAISLDRDGRIQLAAMATTESSALARALSRALDVAAGENTTLTEPVRITRSSGASPLLVVPVPLPPPAFELWALSSSARLLVLIADPSTKSRREPTCQQTLSAEHCARAGG